MVSQAHTLDELLPPIDDDTEEAPWMVMSTPQWHATDALYNALDLHSQTHSPPWLVTALLGVRYRPNPGLPRKEQLAPDVMVAFVPDPERSRTTYDIEREGVPPAFVLEVVSPESRIRDLEIKPRRYERMGVQEYVLFAPTYGSWGDVAEIGGTRLLDPPLQGYRRDTESGRFERWEPTGMPLRLYSEVLGLWIVGLGPEVRAQLPDGTLLPTPREIERARREAEAEVARLRAELEPTRRAPE